MLSDMSHVKAISMEDYKIAKIPTEAEKTFASKYLPQTFVGHQWLWNAEVDGSRMLDEIRKVAIRIDAGYCGMMLLPLMTRLTEIRAKRNILADMFKQQKLLHAVDEVSAEQLAELDDKTNMDILAFEKRMQVHDYVRGWLNKNWVEDNWVELANRLAPLQFIAKNMIPIPDKDYRIGKCEVTQALWEAVMGRNPLDDKEEWRGWSRPVGNVSWNDCQEFLQKLNAMPEVKASGLFYRLPTADEWEYACRAGATGDYCKLLDGAEVNKSTLNEVAWFNLNCSMTHPVGQKKPNAFGLCDMHGNVEEWTQTSSDGCHICCGGCWTDWAVSCKSSNRQRASPSCRNPNLGFRLCASGKAE